MAVLDPSRLLKKDLTLLNVYAISVGATLSSGFFLLPGLAAAEAGPAVVLTYLIALLPLIPGILSKVELSTAMPRAGGVYYFLDRSIGPIFGTIGGIGTWLALVLKVSFALVGIGAYVGLFWESAPTTVIAISVAIALGVLNCFGARKTGSFQVYMVLALLALLVWFVVRGGPAIEPRRFDGFFDAGPQSILSTAGLVCISYIGLTKVASVSEEVKSPEKTLPRAMFLAVLTASIVYVLGTTVMVGVLDKEDLYGSLTPVAAAADALVGTAGAVVMTFAAVLAFCSVANAGIMSASRYPLAMSRDQLMPSTFQNLGRFGAPTTAVVLTVGMIVVSVVVLDPLRIAKLAGAFQLMLFAFNCLAVIIMRESRIASYDPGYRSPLYPWLHLVGIVAPFVLIAEMGWLPSLFSAGLIVVGFVWYFIYARSRVTRRGAIHQVFGQPTDAGELDRELRGILKEKGLRDHDPFDEVVIRAGVIDATRGEKFETLARKASGELADRLSCEADLLCAGFLEGTRTGATPVSGGIALPHLRLPEVDQPQLVIVRSRRGVTIDTTDALGKPRSYEDTVALFFLVSPDADPGLHLRLLAQLASRVDQTEFADDWQAAPDVHSLKEMLLRTERSISIDLNAGTSTAGLVDAAIRDLRLPDGALVALIRRGSETIVPGGRTVLIEGDRLTIIGSEAAIRDLRAKYPPLSPDSAAE